MEISPLAGKPADSSLLMGTTRSMRVFFSPNTQSRRAQYRLIRIGVLCAIFSFPFGVWGQTIATTPEKQESRMKAEESTRIDYRMPERLQRLWDA
jgi:hypothetical protein